MGESAYLLGKYDLEGIEQATEQCDEKT